MPKTCGLCVAADGTARAGLPWHVRTCASAVLPQDVPTGRLRHQCRSKGKQGTKVMGLSLLHESENRIETPFVHRLF
jgi:hypothetical protein